MNQGWYKHSKDGFRKLRMHTKFQEKIFFGETFLILVPFCNQNGTITLILIISAVKVVIPFWLQKGTKIKKFSSKIFFLESMHSQLSKSVLRMFIPPLVHILPSVEVW